MGKTTPAGIQPPRSVGSGLALTPGQEPMGAHCFCLGKSEAIEGVHMGHQNSKNAVIKGRSRAQPKQHAKKVGGGFR
ncbi:hypothetical protein PAPYR_4267 [Paratrimastix pyriformis]|uniref:Uncharacterized protein n=1 Tax=Paratrimastix pyriformis TaxID=342808 RepID=A0ABQ8UJZ4_9EUKA|nr:hypothetical protein PAPYR_4267 [Paratrimastix pyriformis]